MDFLRELQSQESQAMQSLPPERRIPMANYPLLSEYLKIKLQEKGFSKPVSAPGGYPNPEPQEVKKEREKNLTAAQSAAKSNRIRLRMELDKVKSKSKKALDEVKSESFETVRGVCSTMRGTFAGDFEMTDEQIRLMKRQEQGRVN